MKKAVVTGGTRGIGRASVEALYKAGYEVAFIYKRSHDKARQLVEDLPGTRAYVCDVTREEEVRETFEKIRNDLGSYDLLVNNAGVSFEGLLTDMTLSDWDRVITSDLTSVFLTCREAIPVFVSQKSGVIINVSSMWGVCGASCEVAYSAAKAGLIGFTKALAKELAPSGIRVNAVAPGVIMTDMMSSFSQDDTEALRNETPLERLGLPEDVASSVVFLASEGASFITGEVLNVNGGFVI
jgi:3-oxoacyl-[acyl-carrier protein] reductase